MILGTKSEKKVEKKRKVETQSNILRTADEKKIVLEISDTLNQGCTTFGPQAYFGPRSV